MLVVQKFGGTSLATPEDIERVADRVDDARASDTRLIVVVSAMAGETDRLLALDQSLHRDADLHNSREMIALVATGEQVSATLLAMALQARGIAASSLNAHQIKLKTFGCIGAARVRSVDASAVDSLHASGAVAVVTGFQGVDDAGHLQTLGRGGSDTTAVALAAALGADRCEIYTDVDGVLTADPRTCPDARLIERISSTEMLELASLGARVLQIRSVELAMKYGIPLHVRSSLSRCRATEIVAEPGYIEAPVVTGVSDDDKQAIVTAVSLRRVPDVLAKLLQPLAEHEISVDLITQNVAPDDRATVSFTLDSDRLSDALELLQPAAQGLGAARVTADSNAAKVSVVGIGMRTRAGVAQRVFSILSAARIPILLALSTKSKVSCIVPADHRVRAVGLLHDAFELASRSAASHRTRNGRPQTDRI